MVRKGLSFSSIVIIIYDKLGSMYGRVYAYIGVVWAGSM